MLPEPSGDWFGAGLQWSARHQLAFSYLAIGSPDPADDLHFAIGVAFAGGGQDSPRAVLATLSGVIAGEIIREGTRAGQLKTACEEFEAKTILDLTADKRMAVGVAERHVKLNSTYRTMIEQRRVSEARVVGLRHYADTVRTEQGMLRTDRADARAANFGEAHDAT